MDYDLAVTIHRPPEAVWSFLDDVQEHVHHPGSPVPEMVKIPRGPVHVGTRWRELVQVLPGVTMTVWTDVTAVDTGHLLEETWRAPGMTGWIRYEIEPLPDGCVLHQRETLTIHGPLRLAALPMGRMLGGRLNARLEAIRALLEAQEAAQPS